MKKIVAKTLSVFFAALFALSVTPVKIVPQIITAFAQEEYNLRKVDGKWQYYNDDGEYDSSFVGLTRNENGWWYVSNGRVDTKFVGLVHNENGWWYVSNGRVDTKFVGLVHNENGWWYVSNGRIDTKFVGLVHNENGWWYVSNGRIDKKFVGLVHNENGWWYVSNGRIDKKFVGLVHNEHGWWYVSGGRIDKKFVGLVHNEYGWWYVKNGTVDFKYNGNAKNEYGYWVVTNGKVNGAATWKYNYALPTPEVADTSGDWKLLLVNRDYCLPSGYIDTINLSYVCNSSERLDSRVAPQYEKMYNAAAKEGVYLTPCSGYRSYDLQKRNFENRINTNINYGYSKINATIEASKVILPPGTSEHNAGLAMDIVCVQDSFENSPQYAWLCKHAQDYGFILRYPKNKQDITKIVFEPWHWRYVGVDAAKSMKQSGKCLEEYLGKVK